MKEHTSASLKRQANSALPPAHPRDIHAKASAGFKAWREAKPRSTALPSAWRKGRKIVQ